MDISSVLSAEMGNVAKYWVPSVANLGITLDGGAPPIRKPAVLSPFAICIGQYLRASDVRPASGMDFID
jgi:hypothetical protein